MAKEMLLLRKVRHRRRLILFPPGPHRVQALLGGDLQFRLAATNAVTAAVMAGGRRRNR